MSVSGGCGDGKFAGPGGPHRAGAEGAGRAVHTGAPHPGRKKGRKQDRGTEGTAGSLCGAVRPLCARGETCEGTECEGSQGGDTGVTRGAGGDSRVTQGVGADGGVIRGAGADIRVTQGAGADIRVTQGAGADGGVIRGAGADIRVTQGAGADGVIRGAGADSRVTQGAGADGGVIRGAGADIRVTQGAGADGGVIRGAGADSRVTQGAEADGAMIRGAGADIQVIRGAGADSRVTQGAGADGGVIRGAGADSRVTQGAGADGGVIQGAGADSRVTQGAGADGGVIQGAGADSRVTQGAGADSGVICGAGVDIRVTQSAGADGGVTWSAGADIWVTRSAGADNAVIQGAGADIGVIWGEGADDVVIQGVGADGGEIQSVGADCGEIQGVGADGAAIRGVGSDVGVMSHSVETDCRVILGTGADGGVIRGAGTDGGVNRGTSVNGRVARAAGADGGVIRIVGADGGVIRDLGADCGVIRGAGADCGVNQGTGANGGVTRDAGADGGGIHIVGADGGVIRDLGADCGVIRSTGATRPNRSSLYRRHKASASRHMLGTRCSSSSPHTRASDLGMSVCRGQRALSNGAQEERGGRRRPVTVDSSKAKTSLEALRISIKQLKWKEFPLGRRLPCDIYWHGASFYETENISFGHVNKFPGMAEMVRKINLSRALRTLQQLYPQEYDYYPQSWILPEEYHTFTAEVRMARDSNPSWKPIFIVKPDGGCQGDGIYLIKDPCEVRGVGGLQSRPAVVQEYVRKPLLVDKLKFDMRLYVVLTSLEPLEIYISHDGLSRFCTEPYQQPTHKNLHRSYMHLTNYSLNIHSGNFIHSDSAHTGSKRTVSSVLCRLLAKGMDIRKVWSDITALVIKTVISLLPELKVYHQLDIPAGKPGPSCFQILGFDVLLLKNLKPVLLEVNANPSMKIEHEQELLPGVYENVPSPVDEEVKVAVIRDTLRLVDPGRRRSSQKPSPSLDTMTDFHTEPTDSCNTDTPTRPEKQNLPPLCLKQVYPKYARKFCHLRVLERVGTLFIRFLGVKGSMRMGPTGFRTFIRSCKLSGGSFSMASGDILYIDITRRWSNLEHRESGKCTQSTTDTWKTSYSLMRVVIHVTQAPGWLMVSRTV
ncbi:tubulin polyglutamylase TTLL11 isoform X2 [Ranitomeya imitator]|uniref:tubulin polyglutamylase TTLL11 isoform X2 n=1 Tax=Ranitomeya imitator TaxID=111125 RepID=UPI0037E73EE6